ncbi:MAG: hypothetical protein LUM44_20310 [Pyrinomonadaceae bacterium]|nr:hypothetical protein [Pyrinomonadaceae bacterium]
MRNVLLFLFILFSTTGASLAQNSADIIKVEAKPEKGFSYPYYLYMPPEIRDAKVAKRTHTILVIPNNTGKLADDLNVHETDVKKRITQNAGFANQMKVAVLTPVFPRSETDWQIYTHALDRDTMTTAKKEYARLDLQLIAMIDDAREKWAKEKVKLDKKVLLTGFSASGMFANRFAFLHPERVKAAAIGSPGGWAIAPTAVYKEKTLRYPIGIEDFKTVSGKKLNLNELRKVPLFIFLGDKDENDSVIFGDSYEDSDKDLIFALFGKTPVERWESSKNLYKQAKLNAEFKLYPNVEHTITKEMRDDIMNFLSKYVK